MTVIKKVISVFALVYFSLNAIAQQGLETGIWLGTVNYFGDLNTNMRLNRLGPAGGIGIRYNFNERVCGKLSGNIGRVEAYDKD